MSKRDLTEPSWRPLGVPLDLTEAALAQTTLKTSRDGDTLVVDHGKVMTRVVVLPPRPTDASPAAAMRAVVTVTTELPPLPDNGPPLAYAVFGNTFATLGALTIDHGRVFIGSRITTYDDKEWSLYAPLLGSAITCASDGISYALGMREKQERGKREPSAWTKTDLQSIADGLEGRCAPHPRVDDVSLTAKLALYQGPITPETPFVLWRLSTDQPHRALGGGLRCVLMFPHPYDTNDEKSLEIVNTPNLLEMTDYARPPHLGAWTARADGWFAYATFLPNSLHWVDGLALHVSSWAWSRALGLLPTLQSVGL